ncbi:MAG TPA: dCTP deaminase [Mycobacteriales bacterium]|nr:dCTP deaminase [Mycobacteriales bacterium]
MLDGVLEAAGDTDRSGRPGVVTECERLAELVVEVAASLGLRPVVGKASGRRRGVEAALHEVRWPPADQPARRGLRLPGGRAARARAVVAVRPTASVPVRCIEVAAASGTFLVGRTYVPTHNSSLGRLGLLTHSTAGFIDPGFSGHVTLELSNVANLPIKLYPGMKIGQVCVFRLTSPAEHPYGSDVYGSRYQGQRGPTPSRSHLRFSRASTLPPG